MDYGRFHNNFHDADGLRSAGVGHCVAQEPSEHYDEKCCGRCAGRFHVLVVRLRAVVRAQLIHQPVHRFRRLHGRSRSHKSADGTSVHRLLLPTLIRHNGDNHFIRNRRGTNQLPCLLSFLAYQHGCLLRTCGI